MEIPSSVGPTTSSHNGPPTTSNPLSVNNQLPWPAHPWMYWMPQPPTNVPNLTSPNTVVPPIHNMLIQSMPHVALSGSTQLVLAQSQTTTPAVNISSEDDEDMAEYLKKHDVNPKHLSILKNLRFERVKDLQSMNDEGYDFILNSPEVKPFPPIKLQFSRLYEGIKKERAPPVVLQPPSVVNSPAKRKTASVQPSPKRQNRKLSDDEIKLLQNNETALPKAMTDLISNLRSWENGAIFISAAGTLQHATLHATSHGYYFECHCKRKGRTPGVYRRKDRDGESLSWQPVKKHVEDKHVEREFQKDRELTEFLFPGQSPAPTDVQPLAKEEINGFQSDMAEYLTSIFAGCNPTIQRIFLLKLLSNATFTSGGNLMELLIASCHTNLLRAPQGRRFELILKEISFLLWFYAQGYGYEFFARNLPGILPQRSTINWHKRKYSKSCVLGVSREAIELAAKFFRGLRYKNMMFIISEDSTSVIPGVQWNPRDNTIVGLLPDNKKFTCSAQTFEQIKSAVDSYNFACDIHILMLIPVFSNFPPFIIGVLPSNRTETAIDLMETWKECDKLASGAGIRIIGHTADGEQKQLSAMKQTRQTLIDACLEPWDFKCNSADFQLKLDGLRISTKKIMDEYFPEVMFQDMIHVGTKLRNGLLGSRVLLFGKHDIAIDDLKDLLSQKGEESLDIRQADLDPVDKMNFPAVDRLCKHKVEVALRRKSKIALANYLKLIRYSVFAFIDKKLSLKARIQQMAYAAFMIMFWKELNPAKNIPTFNQQSCIILNFVNFVCLLSFCMKHRPDTEIFPANLGSQHNEQLFRTLRMMNGLYSTRVNFTVLDVMNRIHVVQRAMMLKIKHQDFLQFPQHHKHFGMEEFSFVADQITAEELEAAIKSGFLEVENDVQSFLDPELNFALEKFKTSTIDFSSILTPKPSHSSAEEEEADDDTPSEVFGGTSAAESVIELSCKPRKLTKEDAYVMFKNKEIHKSRLCAILSNHAKIPADRIFRVRNIVHNKNDEILWRLIEQELPEEDDDFDEDYETGTEPEPENEDEDECSDLGTVVESLAIPDVSDSDSGVDLSNRSEHRQFLQNLHSSQKHANSPRKTRSQSNKK